MQAKVSPQALGRACVWPQVPELGSLHVSGMGSALASPRKRVWVKVFPEALAPRASLRVRGLASRWASGMESGPVSSQKPANAFLTALAVWMSPRMRRSVPV